MSLFILFLFVLLLCMFTDFSDNYCIISDENKQKLDRWIKNRYLSLVLNIIHALNENL